MQILLEFLPISSSLFIETFNVIGTNFDSKEIILCHIFSSVLFIIIFFPRVYSLLKGIKKHYNILLSYIISLIPIIIVGIITDVFGFKYEFDIFTQIIFNLVSGLILFVLCDIYGRDKSLTFFNLRYDVRNIITYEEAFVVGVLTSLNGFFPGMSRLGTSLMYLIYKKKDILHSYEFSLITSIPVLMGKPLLMLVKDPMYSSLFCFFIEQNYLYIIGIIILMSLIYSRIKSLFTIKFLRIIILCRVLYFFFILSYSLYKLI